MLSSIGDALSVKLPSKLKPELRPELGPKLGQNSGRNPGRRPHPLCCYRARDQWIRVARFSSVLSPRGLAIVTVLHTSASRSFSDVRASLHSGRRRSTEVVTSMSTCLKIAVAAALLAGAATIAVRPPTSYTKDDGVERMSSPSRPSEAAMFK